VKLWRLLEVRGRMTAPELASELEVSIRTVLRDVDELSGVGIPVYSVRGRRGGFELVGGPPRLRLSGWSAESPPAQGLRATVRLSPDGRKRAVLLGRRVRVRRRSTSVRGREDWRECSLEIDSIESAIFDLLALGTEIEVVGPLELRMRIAVAAVRIAELHGVAAPQRPLAISRAVQKPGNDSL
jgi:predicted DNA-binding transcriptional regulator YafY